MSVRKEQILQEIDQLNLKLASGACSTEESKQIQVRQDILVRELVTLNKSLNENALIKG
jgi:hypothetical protein